MLDLIIKTFRFSVILLGIVLLSFPISLAIAKGLKRFIDFIDESKK